MDRNKIDERFMRLALDQAQAAAERDEVPVGAVIVSEGSVIGEAHNEILSAGDPTGHAEIVAIRRAARRINNYRLIGCDLYVTLEPCAMCMGAAVLARLQRLIYGAPDPKAGAVESVIQFPIQKLNHQIEIKGGILAEECGRILKIFFRKKR